MSNRSRVTPEGEKLGQQMARLCDIEVKKLIAQDEYTEDQRCISCAFKLGTVPNGCTQTQMDALKSVLEHAPFYCHVKVGHVCAGWFSCVQAVKKGPKVICPWDYSPPDKS